MGKERHIRRAGPAILAAVSFAVGMLISPEAHAATEALTGEGSFLSTLLAHLLDGPGAEGPRCSGFRACDLLFVALIGLVVVAALRFRHATQRKRLDLARRMVEQGMEPPAELLGRAGNDLRRGLVLAFTGVGLLAASFFGGSGDLSPAGLIPGFIGLGYLASHRFAGKKRGPKP